MAINRLDYKYVHNTLPTSKEDISDRNLKVGSKVENLLPVLSDDTVYNPELDYYADRDASRCWYVSTDLGEFVIDVTIYHMSKDSRITYRQQVPISYGYKYGYDMLYFRGIIPNAVNIRAENNYTSSEEPNFTYNTQTGQLSADFFSSLYYWSSNENATPEDDPSGKIYYEAPSTENTKNNGQLQTVVDLDNTKQYVIQVVNAYNSTEKNKIILLDSNNKETSTSYEFDNYLCFTPKESGTYAFKINGLSFGCKVYGLDNNNNVIELRNYIAPSTAQVYLFESDKPWMVDIDGTITGMSESAATTSVSATTVEATLDNDKIKSMFSAAPSLTINSDGNLVVSVEGIDTTL